MQLNAAQPKGALGVNTTGIDSRPLTKFAGRSGNAASDAASRRSGSRRSNRYVINDSSKRANWLPRQKWVPKPNAK